MKKLLIICLIIVSVVSLSAEIRKYTVNNIDVIYDYDKSYNISAMTIFFDGGTLNYKPENAGIETFLLQAIQKGSKKYPMEEYDKLMDRYGIQVDFTADYDYSYIGFSSINKYFKEAIDILISSVKKPLLNEKQIENVKQKIIADLKQQADSPDEIVWDRLNDIYYEGHPYYGYPKGRINTIERISVNDLKKHIEYLTQKNRIIISIVSGIEPEKVIDYLKTELKGIKSIKQGSDFKVPQYTKYAGDREMRDSKENLMTSYVAVKYEVPSILSDDYANIRIGLSILSRRVYEVLRTKYGLTYAAFVGASMRKTNYGYFYVSTDYPDSSITLTMNEFENAKRDGVMQEEIDNITNLYETSYYMQNEQSLNKSVQTGYDYMIYDDFNHSGKFIQLIKDIKPDVLKELFNTYLSQYTIFILEKPE